MDKPAIKVFLSYCWKDTPVANIIDDDFKAIGILMQRDVRDILYRRSIKEFMELVGKSDYVVMLISKDYLTSENCMHEVMELLQTHELEKRILPVLLDSANGIFDPAKRLYYYEHWRSVLSEREKAHSLYDNEDTLYSKRKLTRINENIAEFFNAISRLNLKTFEQLKLENYRSMMELLGLDRELVLSEILDALKIADKEERELKLEDLLANNRTNSKIWFELGFVMYEKGYFKKAKKYYAQSLALDPEYVGALNAMALLLNEQDEDDSVVENYYQRALAARPDDADTYGNYAVHIGCYAKERDPKRAKEYFEKSLQLEPQDALTEFNYAILCNRLEEYTQAKYHYEKALQINPDYVECHNNLAGLLNKEFQSFDLARAHYESALKVNPNHAPSLRNLGELLIDPFAEYDLARSYLEKAILIDTKFIFARLSLAALLNVNYGQYQEARLQYEQVLVHEPDNAEAHYKLANLLADIFELPEQAISHYQRAIANYPDYADVYINYGVVLIENFDNIDEARALYKKAISIKPSLKNEKRDSFFDLD